MRCRSTSWRQYRGWNGRGIARRSRRRLRRVRRVKALTQVRCSWRSACPSSVGVRAGTAIRSISDQAPEGLARRRAARSGSVCRAPIRTSATTAQTGRRQAFWRDPRIFSVHHRHRAGRFQRADRDGQHAIEAPIHSVTASAGEAVQRPCGYSITAPSTGLRGRGITRPSRPNRSLGRCVCAKWVRQKVI